MSKIFAYCDASYKDGKAGYAIMLFLEDKQDEAVFVFGKFDCSTSFISELTTVIKTLEYILVHFKEEKDNVYQIGIDELSIVKFISSNVYKRFIRFGWKKYDGRDVKANVDLWKRYAYLYTLFPKDSIKIRKVKSKKNHYNNIADKIAKLMVNKELEDEHLSFFVNDSNYNSILLGKFKGTRIEIKAETNESDFNTTIGEKASFNLNKTIDWASLSNTNKIEYLLVDDIEIIESVHLKAQSINFNGMLLKIKEDNEIITPIAVKKLDGSNGYALIAGVTRLFTCKILDIRYIPSIIYDKTMTHKEFIQRNSR